MSKGVEVFDSEVREMIPLEDIPLICYPYVWL